MMTSSKKPDDARPAMEAQIVENLRRVYNAKLEEEVPDRFLSLLDQLRQMDDKTNDEKSES